MQVAEQLRKDGFDAKAVAIYKQILRIDEGSLEARIQLGELFQRLGLLSDALREFQAAIQTCEQRELKREAFDLLKKVAALDPEDVPNRLRLADLFLRQDLSSEALEQYDSLIGDVEAAKNWEPLARACKQMLASFPDNARATASLGRAKIELGDAQGAITQLTQALPRFPEEVSVREVLVSAYEVQGDEAQVQRTWAEIAELLNRRGDSERAREILQRFAPVEPFSEGDEPDPSASILLSDPLAGDLESPASEAESASAAMADTPPGLTPAPPAAETITVPPEELLAEARVSLDFGDLAAAEDRLDLLLQQDPDHVEAKAMLEQIRTGSTRSSALSVDDADQTAPSMEKLPPIGPESSAPLDTLPNVEISLEDEGDRDSRYASVDAPDEATQATAGSGSDDVDVEVEISLDDEAAASVAESLEDTAPDHPVDSPKDTVNFGADYSSINEDLEEAEFYYEQGMLTEAEEAYARILERAPHHPKAMLRHGEIQEARGHTPAADPAAPKAGKRTAKSASKPASDLPAPEAPDLDLEGFPESDTLGDAAPIASGETLHGEELIKSGETVDGIEEVGVVAGSDDAAFDLAAELEETMRSGMEGGGFQEVFSAFKRQIQSQIADDESDAHYDLAIAYREMGLVEDAIGQLEIVRSRSSMQIEMYSLLATCKLEFGQPLEAAAVLEEAIERGAGDEEAGTSLRYDLGEALLAAGKRSEALEAFEKVAALDPSHREVEARLEELR